MVRSAKTGDLLTMFGMTHRDTIMALMKTAFRLFLVFFIFSTNLWAGDFSSPWFTQGADKKVIINVEMFLSSTCPHCHKADAFFSEVEASSPDLHIQRYIINQDKNALIRFNQLLSEQQMDDFVVPSIYFCGSRWVGFASAETTGKDLLHAINYCKQQIEKKGELTQATVNTLKHWANANKFDSGMSQKPSALRYIVTLALTDAISPCALFCFAGFLAVLLIEEQRKKRLIGGVLFIVSVALVHYFQQANTSVFFELLPWFRVPAALFGLIILYFVRQRYKREFNTRLYFLVAFFLGLMTMIYQQTCVMNWSTIFEQWLNNQQIPGWQASIYQLLYQVMYLLPLIVTLIVCLGLLTIRRIAVLNARWVAIGSLLMVAIALCLIVYPFVLSYFISSLLTLIIVISCGYLASLLNLT